MSVLIDIFAITKSIINNSNIQIPTPPNYNERLIPIIRRLLIIRWLPIIRVVQHLGLIVRLLNKGLIRLFLGIVDVKKELGW